MQQMAFNLTHLHMCIHIHTHISLSPPEIHQLFCMASIVPLLCSSHPNTPHPPRGCYGPASTTPVSRIRRHTLHSDWLPAMLGWAHKKRKKKGRGEKKRKRVILVVRWMTEAARLQAEYRAPF